MASYPTKPHLTLHAPLLFNPSKHHNLLATFAAILSSCIISDHLTTEFLPPLSDSALLDYWLRLEREVRFGERVIVVLFGNRCLRSEHENESESAVDRRTGDIELEEIAGSRDTQRGRAEKLKEEEDDEEDMKDEQLSPRKRKRTESSTPNNPSIQSAPSSSSPSGPSPSPAASRSSRDQQSEVAGLVSLVLCTSETGRHRANVELLLVSPDWRNRGVSRLLMKAVEKVAWGMGRSLLILETETDSIADMLFPKLGYRQSGKIPGYAVSPRDKKPKSLTGYYKHLTKDMFDERKVPNERVEKPLESVLGFSYAELLEGWE